MDLQRPSPKPNRAGAQGLVQLSLEHLQGWGFHSLFGKPIIWSHSWRVNYKIKKVLIICDWNFMCLSLSVASHHSAVHFGEESDSIYSISSVAMGFPLVAKAVFSIWTEAELVVKSQAVFPWRPFWSYTSQIPSLMFWRWRLECGWFSIPVTADLLLSINIQQFHSRIFLKCFPLSSNMHFVFSDF